MAFKRIKQIVKDMSITLVFISMIVCVSIISFDDIQEKKVLKDSLEEPEYGCSDLTSFYEDCLQYYHSDLTGTSNKIINHCKAEVDLYSVEIGCR